MLEESVKRGELATTRRLLCALLNEGLLPAKVISTPKSHDHGEVATQRRGDGNNAFERKPTLIGLFPKEITNEGSQGVLVSFYCYDYVSQLAVKSRIQSIGGLMEVAGGNGNEEINENGVLYVDPEDVAVDMPISLLVLNQGNQNQLSKSNGGFQYERVTNPVSIMEVAFKFLSSNVDLKTASQILAELESSARNQAISYAFQKKEPPTLADPSIAWEQSIIEGHSIHPMHRTRLGFTCEQMIQWTSECEGTLEILFVSVPRSEVTIYGEFEALLKNWLPDLQSSDHVVIPIHEGQWPTLSKLFPNAVLLPFTKVAKSQTSIRSVVPLDLPFHLKLALNVYSTSALRTISPYSVFNGPLIGRVAKLLAPPKLLIIEEVASIGSNHSDYSIAKHLACLIRENPETLIPNQRHIVCASLVERDINGVPLVISALKLDTKKKCLKFGEKYITDFLECFIPPMLQGLAFEAHGQNTLTRFDSEGNLLGFSIRDFGGIKYHPETVKKHTGIELTFLPESSILAHSMEEVYRNFFHSGIQSHLQRIIRVLGLHQDGSGWEIARKVLTRLMNGNPLLYEWLAPYIHVKSLLSMKLDGLYRDFLYHEVPNFLYLQRCEDSAFQKTE